MVVYIALTKERVLSIVFRCQLVESTHDFTFDALANKWLSAVYLKYINA